MRMAKVVQPDAWQARLADQSLERVREHLGMDGGAVEVAKDVTVVLETWAAGRSENADRALVEVDRAPRRASLPARFVEFVSDRDERAIDRQPGRLEIHIGPAQSENLATAHAGIGGQPQGGKVGIASGQGEKTAKLIGIPSSELA